MSLASRKSYLVIIGPNSHAKFTKNQNWVKLELVQTLLRITRLAQRNSYLSIIDLISHEKLTKSDFIFFQARVLTSQNRMLQMS